MKENIKSGKEVLEEFISNIKSNKNFDEGIVNMITDLNEQGKLTKTNMINGLSNLRELDKNED